VFVTVACVTTLAAERDHWEVDSAESFEVVTTDSIFQSSNTAFVKLGPVGTHEPFQAPRWSTRWEEESRWLDHLPGAQLRSQIPAGVIQEIYGLLLGHYAIRSLISQAAAGRGIDPDRLSFTDTLKILRCRLPECPWSRSGLRQWHQALLAEIAEVINSPRRNRINPRVIKKKMSNWPKKRPQHRRYPQPLKNVRESIVLLN
jgi:hypothetical protein